MFFGELQEKLSKTTNYIEKCFRNTTTVLETVTRGSAFLN